MERQEKSVIGGGSSESSVVASGWGLRRRAIGGGMALSRNGKENNLELDGNKKDLPKGRNFTGMWNCEDWSVHSK